MRKKPARANGKENKIIRDFLEARCLAEHDQLLCEICLGKVCGCKDTKSSGDKLINEHIDGDSNNWHPDNLRLASQSCNMREWHRTRGAQKVGIDNKGERGRGREQLIEEIIKIKDLKYDSVSMWKSIHQKSKFFKYVESEMRRHPDGVDIEDLVYDGANVTGLSSKTTREYLKEKTRKTGPYRIIEGDNNINYLSWKIKFLEKLYSEELKKYTK